jgi:hypothetical protein
VNGTTKSERALGLDDGECNTFTIGPGQYDRSLHSIDDLIAQIEHSAYARGEWISSLSVDGADLVERVIANLLVSHQCNIEVVLQALAEMGMFCNACADELTPIVLRVRETLSNR